MMNRLKDLFSSSYGRSPLALVATVVLALFGSVSIAYEIAIDMPVSKGVYPAIVEKKPPPASPTVADDANNIQPTYIKIPSLAIESSVIHLGKNGDESVEVPKGANHESVGWYKYSSEPGVTGPSVFLGHYDSETGPSIFYNLADLKVGDLIVVSRANGSEVRFKTTSVELYPKNIFPTKLVYGLTKDAQIRLVTCGGDFDQALDDYKDNVIVQGDLIQ